MEQPVDGKLREFGFVELMQTLSLREETVTIEFAVNGVRSGILRPMIRKFLEKHWLRRRRKNPPKPAE